jgi:hypothetical protein
VAFFPFHKELDQAVRNEHSLLLRIAAGMAAGAVAGVLGFRHVDEKFIATWYVAAVSITSIVGGIVAIVLSMKDAVVRRLERGDYVHPLLRLYFAMRFASLFVWFFSLLMLGMGLTIILVVVQELLAKGLHGP